jgi:hypothetical protein
MILKNILFYFAIMSMLIFISCNANQNNIGKDADEKKDNNPSPKTTDKQNEGKQTQSYIYPKTFEIEPLTYNNYTSIRNNQESFSTLIIEIEKETDDPFVRYVSHFHCKQLAGSHHYSDCTVFKGVLTSLKEPYGPDADCYYEVEFDGEEMEEILSYLEANHEYFFNNEEFNGLDIPFIVQRNYIDAKNYNFRLYVHEPNPSMEDNFHIKLINKYTDELVPETPLYGLFQIWEDQFLYKLLQNKIECF